MNDDKSGILPSHIEATVRATAELHADHHRAATPYQRAVARMTAALGEPGSVGAITVIVVIWLAINLAAPRALRFDPPPFNLLAMFASVAALFMTVLILTTQRHADRLAEHRAQLTLGLAITNEQKTSKVIELVEGLRRDHPEIPDRIDAEALAMASSSHPQHVSDAIKETNEELRP